MGAQDGGFTPCRRLSKASQALRSRAWTVLISLSLSLTDSLRSPDLGWSRPAGRKGDTQKSRRNFGDRPRRGPLRSGQGCWDEY